MRYETSYIPADRSTPILDLSVGDLLRRAAALAPDGWALIDGSGSQETRGRWTYAELLTEAEMGARALLRRFKVGEHVAILAPNSPSWTFAQLSAALAGLVLVTVNPALRPSEVQFILEQSEVAGVIVGGRFRDQDLEQLVDGLQTDLTELREDPIRLATWDTFRRPVADDNTELPDVSSNAPVMIQYTSGTTGVPKGAVLSHLGVVNAGHMISRRLERKPGDIWLNPLPMFHTGGCVMGTMGCMASLGTNLIVSEFDPAVILRLIEEERPIYALGVPTMVLALLEHPDFATTDCSSLEVFSAGAATVPPSLVRRIEDSFGVTFNMAMGQTESSSAIFMSRLDSTIEHKAETLGVPLDQVETMIADETGRPVPIGVQGEICCRGFGVMLGYHNLPEATADAIDVDGWLHTGDLGVMDADGYTRITGRIKDMIIRGGENIFPREIEDVLITHPGVAEAVVVGVHDDHWGERPVGFIRCTDSGPPTEEDLTAFLKERIAAHKVPREWLFVEAFPMNATGKIQKFVLREQYEGGNDSWPA